MQRGFQQFFQIEFQIYFQKFFASQSKKQMILWVEVRNDFCYHLRIKIEMGDFSWS